jgi:hypothetical protein
LNEYIVPVPDKELRGVMIFELVSFKKTDDDDGFSSISTSKFAAATEKIARKLVRFIINDETPASLPSMYLEWRFTPRYTIVNKYLNIFIKLKLK